MKKLVSAKTRTVLETVDLHFERGRWRQIIVECHPQHAVLRLKGTRQCVTASWAGLYQHLMLVQVEKQRGERAKARRATKGKR